jgi:hypothetical protein
MTLAVPEARSWALVPSRAKADVVAAVQRLRHEALDMPGMPVFGLVDADRDAQPEDDHIVAWPVAMIENLLLDPTAIYAALRPYGAQTAASSPAAVSNLLQTLVTSRIAEEVQLRVRRHLPVGRITLDLSSSESVEDQASANARKWAERVTSLDVQALAEAAQAEVDAIVATGSALEQFHGKRLLRAVFDGVEVQRAGLSHAAFELAVAAQASGNERVARLTRPAVDRIRLYFPAGLPEALGSILDPAAAGLAETCRSARTAWEQGRPDAAGREELRRALFALAPVAAEPTRIELVVLASEIGTP